MGHRTRQAVIGIVCVVAITVAASVMHFYGSRIRATTWHLQHGDFAIVAGYRIRVPNGWFVEQSSAEEAHWWDAETGDSIWFRTYRKSPHFTLDFWNSVETRMAQPDDAIVGRLELRVAGEPFLCLERDLAENLPPSASRDGSRHTVHLASVDCASTGRLDATFFGGMHSAPRRDFQEFYALLATIQKQ